MKCNNKLIGARFYVEGFGKSRIADHESLSPLDVGGHGSHTASTAAGNEGVTATVKQVPNAIGYVESAYAKQNKLSYALIQNKAGKFPQPDDKAFQAAAASGRPAPLICA